MKLSIIRFGHSRELYQQRLKLTNSYHLCLRYNQIISVAIWHQSLSLASSKRKRARAALHSRMHTHRRRAKLSSSFPPQQPTKCNAPGVCCLAQNRYRGRVGGWKHSPHGAVDYVPLNVKPTTQPRWPPVRANAGPQAAAEWPRGHRGHMDKNSRVRRARPCCCALNMMLSLHICGPPRGWLFSELRLRWHPATPASIMQHVCTSLLVQTRWLIARR